jgi:hypothetical protein
MQVLQSTPRAAVFRTKSLRGGGKIFALPRATAGTSDSAVKDLSNIIAAVDKHDEIFAERRRTAVDAEEREQISKMDRSNRSAIASVIADSMAKLAKDKAATAAKRAKILNPPPLTDKDHVTAIRESEARQGMRNLSTDQQARVMATVTDDPSLLLALARSPSPLDPIGDGARALYRGQQMRVEAEALAALDAEDEGHDTMETSLNALNQLISGV